MYVGLSQLTCSLRNPPQSIDSFLFLYFFRAISVLYEGIRRILSMNGYNTVPVSDLNYKTLLCIYVHTPCMYKLLLLIAAKTTGWAHAAIIL